MSAVLKFPRTRNRRVGRCAGPVPEGMILPMMRPEPTNQWAVTIDPCLDRTELHVAVFPADVAGRVIAAGNEARVMMDDGGVLVMWRELAEANPEEFPKNCRPIS